MANVQGEGSAKSPGAKSEVTTIRRFLELLEAADILAPVDMAAVKQQLPEAKRDADAAEVARKLVSQNALTKHQAASLYQQKSRNLGLGPYIFLDRLGTGGMGSVFKGKHRQTGDIVAVKVLHLSGSKKSDSLKRFQREFQTAARLNHPNIVRALESGEAGGEYYTAMELVEGTDLSTHVKKVGRMPWEQAAQCVITAARALAYAHEQGIIHRDIKPANLMLCNDGTVKVLDLGLARLQDNDANSDLTTDGLTQTGQVMGTVDYMAPEQALHTRLADARADVYSLGCTLFRLVTGDIPFDGESMVAKILAHREMPIPSMRRMNPEVPSSGDVVLQKMLAKRPEDRYQTMNELADDLERAVQGYALAPPPSVTMPKSTMPPLPLPTAHAPPPLPPLPTFYAMQDADSRSNSLTVGMPRPTPPLPPSARKPQKQGEKRTPIWIPIAVGVAIPLILVGIAWLRNGPEPTIAINPEPVQEATPITKPQSRPSPSPTIPTSSPPTAKTEPEADTTAVDGPLVINVTSESRIQGTVANLPIPAPPAATLPDPAPPVDESSTQYLNDRELALWCLDRGHQVRIHDPANPNNSNLQTIRSVTELPANNFAVLIVLFNGTQRVDVESIIVLTKARYLQGVYFGRSTNVEPRVWGELASLRHLQYLSIRNPAFRDRDCDVFRWLGALKQIDLIGTQCTAACLDAVADVATLSYLNLTGLPITDADFTKLARLKAMRRLYVAQTQITDDSIPIITTAWPQLLTVTLAGTKVTDAGRNQLLSTLPQCIIDPTQLLMTHIPRPSIPITGGASVAATSLTPTIPVTTSPTATSSTSIASQPQPVPTTPAGPKLPVPTDAELAPALKLIREELLKEKYAVARKPEERVSLATELLGQAKTLGDDAMGVYASLREARDMAVDGGDMGLAISACVNAAERFEIDALEWLAEACEAALKKVQPRQVSKAQADGLVPKIDEAVTAKKFAVGERLLQVALAGSRKAQDATATKYLVDRQKQFNLEKQRHEELVEARKTLADKPDDPAANVVLGKYACFVEGKWDEGLKLLAKGNDAVWKDLAEKSLAAPVNGDLVLIGDQWWTQGEKGPKAVQKDFLLGALYWYEKSVPHLSGLMLTRVNKRITDARSVLGTAAPPLLAPSLPQTPTAPAAVPTTPTTTLANATPQEVVRFVLARKGGVAVTMSSGTKRIGTDADLADALQRYPRFLVQEVNFFGQRGALITDADLAALAAVRTITEIQIMENPGLTDAGVAPLGGLPELEYLRIENSPLLTDAALTSFAKSMKLRRISLTRAGVTGAFATHLRNIPLDDLGLLGTKVTDATMPALGSLPNLRSLGLSETAVTDDGVALLANRSALTLLSLSKTRVTGASLRMLRNSPNLAELFLDAAAIDDASLEVVLTLPGLTRLLLDNTPITDVGLATVVKIPKLDNLYLNDCKQITSQGAALLRNAPTLKYVFARRTSVTPDVWQMLKTQLPNCKFYTD